MLTGLVESRGQAKGSGHLGTRLPAAGSLNFCFEIEATADVGYFSTTAGRKHGSWEGHNSSKKAQQEPDYALAGYPVLQRPVSQAPGPPDQQGTM